MPMPLLPIPIPTRTTSNFDAKRFCLRSLLWAGLLSGSTRGEATPGGPLVKTEQPLMLGSPTATTVHISTTRTVTITVTYKPTLAPGDGTYTLLGCYGEPSTGHIFNEDGSYKTPDGIAEQKLTIEECLKGCAASKPPEKELTQYSYAGMRNGSECFCGSKLLPDAPKLPRENCTVACTGDVKLSCGGHDAIAIYGLVGVESKGPNGGAGGAGSTSGDESHGGSKGKGGLSTASTASGSGRPTTTTGTSHKPTATSGKLSSSSAKVTGAAASSSSGHTGSDSDSSAEGSSQDQNQEQQQQGAPPRRTVAAAVGGSMSGAAVLAALLYFCFRAYRRKRTRQEEHVSLVLEKKQQEEDENRKKKNKSSAHPPTLVLDNSHRDIHLTVDGVPTTPTLESGSGGRRPDTADDSLFRTLMGDVRHGGGGGAGKTTTTNMTITTTGPKDAGQSSAVQWRRGDGDGAVPPSPRVPFGNGMGGGGGGSGFGSAPGGTTTAATAAGVGVGAAVGGAAAILAGANKSAPAPAIPRPEHAAQRSPRLGDHANGAWHRRKVSTPFPPHGRAGNGRPPISAPMPAPPPSAPLLPRSVFAPSTSNVAVAKGGPPSGPPNAPLPPTPRRPRRSFDTLDLSVGSSNNNATTGYGDRLSTASSRASRLFGGRSPPPPLPPLPQPGGGGRNRNSVFGNAAASASTPSLSSMAFEPPNDSHSHHYGYGYGYDGSSNNADAMPLYPSGKGGFAPTAPLKFPRRKDGGPESDSEWDTREPTIPVLPPIRPGETFDPQRGRGGERDGGRDGDDIVSREVSPLSATTVGTSIMDSPTVNHWAQR